MLLLRALRRVPAAQSRRVALAPEFMVSVAHDAGFRALLRAIEGGHNLRPWLSTLVDALDERDALHDDWGIHHFRLGAAPHRKRAGFVARTDEVAFAMVRPDAIYFLVTTSHNSRTAPLVRTQTALVDIVHRNWPAHSNA